MRGFGSDTIPSGCAARSAFSSEPPFQWRNEPVVSTQRPNTSQSLFPDRDNTWINQVCLLIYALCKFISGERILNSLPLCVDLALFVPMASRNLW